MNRGRIALFALFILIIFIVQKVLITDHFAFRADLMLVFVIAVAFLGDGPEGLYLGVACGAFTDLTSTAGLGFYALLGLAAALLAKVFNQRLFKNNVLVFILTTIYVSAAYELIGFTLHSVYGFFSGSGFTDISEFARYIVSYASPVILANAVAAIFMFFIVRGAFFRRQGYWS